MLRQRREGGALKSESGWRGAQVGHDGRVCRQAATRR
jgi:hypothetical protein